MFHIFTKTTSPHEQQVQKYLQTVLGICTNDIALYHTALVHRSASNPSIAGHSLNNERLEFLGDAVLDTLVAEYLFKKFPLKPEGELTEMRSKLVKREHLTQLAQRMHLDDLLTINPYTTAKSAVGDAFEALIGAIFLDKGYKKTKKIVFQKIFADFVDIDTIIHEESNFKSKVLIWAQKKRKKIEFVHELIEENKRSKLYRVKLNINGKTVSEGLEYTIKKAEQIAAERVCQQLHITD